MRFGPVPLEEAPGKILAHNITDEDGRRVLRKGRTLDPAAVATLRALGRTEVFVAELEAGDVHEDDAARRIARLVCGPGLEASAPHLARVNLVAAETGVVHVDAERLLGLNQADGLTVATLPGGVAVAARKRVATIKVIPYALPGRAVDEAEAAARGEPPVVEVRRIPRRSVGLVLVGGVGSREGRLAGLRQAVETRLSPLGGRVLPPAYVPAEVEPIARGLEEQRGAGAELVVVAGETAIMDLDDIIPRGIRRAGGRVEHFGIPVDPGHLLLLAYMDDIPVLGAPGCIRGASADGVDLVLPRLLAGERLTRQDLVALGHGGLLAGRPR